MKFGRYRNWTDESWREALASRKKHRHLDLPNCMLAFEAALILEAVHKGPWRMLWALFKNELHSLWLHYGWLRWEWIRTKVLRRPQDEALAMVDRLDEEEEAIEELVKQL
jgi:hypothetical protein